MAKTSCINGHPMWNGDGKPVIWAYRIGYFVEYMKRHPDCILGDSGNGYQIFDCVREDPEEDLDVWYCDECGSVAVFTGHFRYDYCRMHSLPKIDEDIFDCWEEYVALRDLPFDEFMDFYDGKSPLEAIMTYHFPVKYWVSPDKKLIYAVDSNKTLLDAFELKRFLDFSLPEEQKPEPRMFERERYCLMMEETAVKILGEKLDYTLESVDLLDQIINKVRGFHRKGLLPDTDVLWNISVCLGTYYGEILLRNEFQEKGFNWNTKHSLPVISNEDDTTIIDPIGEAHKAIYVSDKTAEHALNDYYRTLKLIMSLDDLPEDKIIYMASDE